MKTINPQLSLVYLTYRPGGFDLLGESLKLQPHIYELIVVDGIQERVERGIARKYLEDRDIPIRFYGIPKPRVFPNAKHGLACAMNTGALWATTDYVVFLHDFTWLIPGQMTQWLKCRNENNPKTLISGQASVRNARHPDNAGDISIWDGDNPTWHIYEETEKWCPQVMENFYCGVPMSFLDKCNGIDERADLGFIAWPLESMVVMVNHRLWKEGKEKPERELWHAAEMADPSLHPPWFGVSPNPFSFTLLHAAYKEVKNGDTSKVDQKALGDIAAARRPVLYGGLI